MCYFVCDVFFANLFFYMILTVMQAMLDRFIAYFLHACQSCEQLTVNEIMAYGIFNNEAYDNYNN